ncbi:RBBP9/YdeN family alpha/beta hydrolase [Gordonia sp. CPCC 205333]|uniref:RBBP9/YdeN family alpha/beta hydrolase n=1 Tax=Gordonia sp. CPCC 205333 TaxID=3140790 RepID=UPI003AF37640
MKWLVIVVAYVVIPGIDGSDEQHWQTRWERDWGCTAVRISPTSWSAPDLDNWVDAVQVAYDHSVERDPDVVLVAHSLGCWAASRWLTKNPERLVWGAFMVAPPDLNGQGFPRQAAPTFLGAEPEPLECPSRVVASVNDPYCTVDAAVQIAAGWGSPLHLAGSVGHINSASGLGWWRDGRDLLDTFVKR